MKAGKKLIYGVGINDADYNVNTIDEQGKRVRCPIYIQWKNMFMRCYSEAYQSRQPTYAGCSVSSEWYSFMKFRNWMIENKWDGKELDKDILFEGNKVYGSENCTLVDRETNSFFKGSKARNIPRGVHKHRNRWQVLKAIDGKTTLLKSFETKEEAEKFYLKDRYNSAISLSNKQTDQRVIDILRTRFTPKS